MNSAFWSQWHFLRINRNMKGNFLWKGLVLQQRSEGNDSDQNEECISEAEVFLVPFSIHLPPLQPPGCLESPPGAKDPHLLSSVGAAAPACERTAALTWAGLPPVSTRRCTTEPLREVLPQATGHVHWQPGAGQHAPPSWARNAALHCLTRTPGA